MGSNFATELADGTLADLGISLTIEDQIGMHLRGNHYPPVPLSMVQPCIDAINSVNDNGDWNLEIELPAPITWRDKTSAPAHAIIEAHHLHAWLIESEL